MDWVLVAVALGCAILGAFWGLVRMLALALAGASALLLGRLAGPPLAHWAFGTPPTGWTTILASLLSGLVVFALVLLAGLGLRKLLDRLHLTFLDRLLGALTAGGLALAASGILLGLAYRGGATFDGPVVAPLARWGDQLLAAYKPATRSANPNSNPKTPISKGQQPEGP
ncbi:MAG: CvpA family protein [Thermoanaerobaculum sp.]|nr:CvpA family protein [Thermoanaerobaculum sp.]